ncbi:MAG TPA: hypothetical protein GXZ35_00560 [Acholeplasmataceae bacterium]|jgi:maltodextrin utilization protein YvdJ|nr:hypothetical protein [Acholeplasmataceae bacterium]
MKKNNKQNKKKFIEKRVRHDNSVEIIVNETPTKTWWGKLAIILILVGMVLVPVVMLFITIFSGSN